MRPLGQFPPLGGIPEAAPSYGFLPCHGPPPATGTPHNAEFFDDAYQQIGKWSKVRDAVEIRNWTRAPTINALTNVRQDGFAWDPTRQWYLMGGRLGFSTPGRLYYSPDRVTWFRLGTTTLPGDIGPGDDSEYTVAVANDGRWLAILTSGNLVLRPSQAYFNSNTGNDNFTASANQPFPLLSHVYFAPSDNRFVVSGINGSGHSLVWSVDIDGDTWDPLILPETVIDALIFGCGNQGNRLIASPNKLWRTSSVASDFTRVTIPWTALLGLVYLPGAFVFLAITTSAIYSSPNGVVWSQVKTGYEGLGEFVGPASGLGDAVVVPFIYETPDGNGPEIYLIGTNSLRDWTEVPGIFTTGTTNMIQAGNRIAALNGQLQPRMGYSLEVNP